MITAEKSNATTSRSFQSASATTMMPTATSVMTAVRRVVGHGPQSLAIRPVSQSQTLSEPDTARGIDTRPAASPSPRQGISARNEARDRDGEALARLLAEPGLEP